jgi:hypothetical protein
MIVMRPQIFLFAQDLTVEQPRCCAEIDQKYPIRKNEKLANQYNCKCHINGIAAESKDAVRYKSVGTICVNADAKTLSERNQAPQQQRWPCQAEEDPDPRDNLGTKKLLRADGRPVEGGGGHDIKIEEGKWHNQEIRLVGNAKFHRLCSVSFQKKDPDQYHSKHQ